MIHIVTDTTSGLPAGLAQQHDIPVIPQVIMFGDESYLEGVEMDHATFTPDRGCWASGFSQRPRGP